MGLAPLLRPRRGTSLSRVLASRDDVDRAVALDRAGVDGLLRRVVDGFLAGVLLEDDGSTADRFALLLAWMFARGVPCLPASGMQSLPEQVAAPLADRVRLRHRAERVTGTSVVTRDRTWTARQVVVATDGPHAPRAHGGADVPAPRASSRPGRRRPTARTPTSCTSTLARDPRGPLVNTAVVASRQLRAPGAPPGAGLGAPWAPAGCPTKRPCAATPVTSWASTRAAGGWWLGTRSPTRSPPRPGAVLRVPAGAGGRAGRLRRPPRHRLDPGCAGQRPAGRARRARGAAVTATVAFAIATALHAGFQATVTLLVYPVLDRPSSRRVAGRPREALAAPSRRWSVWSTWRCW